MSILNVNQIQPVGSGQTVTISAANITASSSTISASSFVGPLTGNVTSSSTSTFSSGLNVTGGSVGIGTDNPTQKLEVYNSSATPVINIRGPASGSSALEFYASTTKNGALLVNSSGFLIAADNSNPINFNAGGSERLRITTAGYTLFGKISTSIATAGLSIGVNDVGAASTGTIISTVDGQESMYINRLTDDGTLISFRQAGTQEGTISVSGSTVQLNGAHLSRWSQFVGISTSVTSDRPTILRGSVLSNLDEMCEWGDEDNEQLNRMKVSDVEGDSNVAGVFVAWDNDDKTYANDFYCAMTGDFIIRIAQGVTVARGDLLMSAGDGTAKPQDDDIVRSKTIAKVTSTNVSCTYDDGSYCVPCVLMAC